MNTHHKKIFSSINKNQRPCLRILTWQKKGGTIWHPQVAQVEIIDLSPPSNRDDRHGRNLWQTHPNICPAPQDQFLVD